MTRKVAALLLVVGLGGCSTMANHNKQVSSPWLIQRPDIQAQACTPLSKEQELVLGLSQKMMTSGRLHAALANIELLPHKVPEARLNKAQILRMLNRPEAEALYESLLDSCLVASGYHGLAQVAVAEQRHQQALEHLQKAVALAPTNDAMRNDLGVVYLNLRQLEEAQFELVTAIELNEGKPRAAGNLVTLLVYQNRLEQAGKLVSRYQLSPAQYQSAVARARRLQQEDSQLASTSNKAVKRQPAVAPLPVPKKPAPVTANNRRYQGESIQPAIANMAAISGLSSEDSAQNNTAATRPTSRGVQQVRTTSSRAIVPMAITN